MSAAHAPAVAAILCGAILIGPLPARASVGGVRAAARAESLEVHLGAALDRGDAARGLAIADSAVALRRGRAGTRPLAIAAYLDSLALRFFALSEPGGWSAAESCFTRSLALKQRALGRTDPAVALTLGALATLGDYQGHWDVAAVRAQQALDIRLARLGPRDPLVASSRRQLGMLRFQLGQYAAAESLIAASLAGYEALTGDHATQIVDDLNNLGEIERVQDRYDAAERQFRRGLAIARERLPDAVPVRLGLMNNLAGLYRDRAQYADAEPLLEETLRLSERADPPDRVATAVATLNVAEILRMQGRIDEAAPRYGVALTLARGALGNDNPSLTPFVSQAAVSFYEAGRYADAEPLFREALATAERTLGGDHPQVAQSLDDLGRLLERRGAAAAAESTYRRALAIRVMRLGALHPDVAAVRVDLARCLSGAPRPAASAADAELDSALRVLDATPVNPESRLEGHALRSELRRRAGRSADAMTSLAVALDLLDSLRAGRGGGDATRAAFVSQHLGLYHRMVALRLAAGDVEGALQAHERGRARVMRDQVAMTGLDLGAGLPAAERAPLEAEERAARDDIARAQRAIDAARDAGGGAAGRPALQAARDAAARRLEQATTAIEDRSPVWRAVLAANGRPATRDDIRGVLRPGEMLLEYHIGDDASWVFAIDDRGAARAVPLAAGAADAKTLGIAAGPLTAATLEHVIAGDTSRVRALMHPGIAALLSGTATAGAVAPLRGRGAEPPAARPQGHDGAGADPLDAKLEALGRILLPAPVAPSILHAAAAVVVPDGALHLIPFEALVVSNGGKRGVRYWLDDGPPLRYAGSATSLVALERRTPRAASAATGAVALSVSDPQSSMSRWPPLPGTRLEMRAIAATLGAGVDTLTGAAATERAVRARLAGRRIVHLATHGFVTEGRGDVLGGIVLAAPDSADLRSGAADADGLLQLFEIYSLHLDCELAVLSACETAAGARVEGEGVFALSRGFLTAGAERVIASLWSVNDASTATLMGALFRTVPDAMRRGQEPDWALALRQAKRVVRANPGTSAPFFWAPFVLAGVR